MYAMSNFCRFRQTLIFGGSITNFRLTTHCFFSTKKKACQEKPYRTEVIFEDKN